ncbi:MAG: phosphodiester glycosidase family protein [Erysipelotrichaceae bacterium]|nr:phosphodiester glycosidase family protein [Erysipelotrichaceae bacterium]
MSRRTEQLRADRLAQEKRNKKPHWLLIFMIVVDLCAIFCFVMAYSNLDFADSFRSWLVTTSLGTGRHRYLAYILYDEETVKEVAAANTLTPPSGITNADDIQFVEYTDITEIENPYDRQVLTKDPGNDDYKIIPIRENGYAGYMCVIYHPDKLDVTTASTKYGEQISTMARKTKATVATNCSGFVYDRTSHYMIPTTDIVKNGKIVYSFGKSGYLIGMNYDGVLVLRKGTAKDAVNNNYKWAIQFGPYLIVNGVPATFKGKCPGGLEPRTAIGQRKDGIVLLLVIDGRGYNRSKGISYAGLIDIFTRYGCYNAANLDGGGSSAMVVKNEVINSPCDYKTGERYNIAALVYRP